jgi:type VI secretion system protein ImpH
MASPDGQTTDSLIAQLKEHPFAFDFYAAVRLLQARHPDRPRIGHSASPAEDPVRFAQNPALDFAPSTLEAFRHPDPARPPAIYSRHFGLFGPNGPLPLCLTEYAHDRIRHHGDVTFAQFCNVFHHRLLSFFFRAWADGRKTVDFDRRGDRCWPQFVGSLVGLGMESLQDRDSVPDRAKLYLAGRLVQQNRNAEGLEAIIQDFFAVPTEVQTFVGCWLKLPPNSVCRLGAARETGCLGASVIMGTRIWNCQMHVRLRLGPMKLADLKRLLPTGASFRRLRDWVRFYAGEEFTWDAQLVLAKEEIPDVQLGKAGQLGWTTWLKTKPFDRDAEDLVIQAGEC